VRVVEFELAWAERSAAKLDQLRADPDLGYEWLATHDEDWRGSWRSRPCCGGVAI
jgi:hypothetical protein